MFRSIAAASVLLLAPLAPAMAQSVVTGTYHGTIINSAVEIPVDTTIHEKAGVFSGSYVLHDPTDGDVHGKISDVDLADNGVYTLTWTDRYGSGGATLAFAADGSSFTGKWYTDGRVGGFWNGTKVP
jgi:hypothetical protein